MTPVVLIAEELAPAAIEVLAHDFDVRHVDGTDRPALLSALSEADAVIVRSATQIDAEAIAAAPRLKVVARAGVGLDNVEVPAATARGVMVVNAPTSNIVSAAEQAVALLLAVARNTASASAALKAGEWKRSKYTGVELQGKTVGVVGLGRIGVLFASRIAAFGTRLIAYDPYIQPARAAQLGVRLVGLEELLRESDFISIHLPKTPETVGLIGEKELSIVKPGVRIVNAARGGLIDEQALADALAEGRVAGAGVDVYAKEPCTSSPLFAFDNVVATPHLGASTAEAQDKAGLAVAKSVKLALQGEFVPDAVNVQAGGVVAEDVRPLLPLAEKLGRAFTAVAGGVAASVTVEVRGEIVEHDVSVLKLAATKGLFSSVVEEQVTYVNAPHLAAQRGVEVSLDTQTETADHPVLVTVRGALPDGRTVSVSGTVTQAGTRDVIKLTEVDGFDVEIGAEGILLFLRYADRPGVVGTVGTLLGQAGVNIAAMQVARREAGGETLMTLTVDQALGADLLTSAADSIGATSASAADLRDE
ncbi:phosphoglycerate dehydrogenase [Verrucosispora sp. WMMD703]|uniref:D-3-phosphoglycerate dehydrogenase n=1 Tax=Micromonospora sediminimaris TaxID=547162 RepID=A0A9W5UVD2_9ACTN|nr:MULTISPECIES: phosphoglycerate dehydrogenase [Micromonospora]WFE44558.1 phosphoglycerate dehydrogenase [Verrucosispora sp. WMMD1129]GIJ35746.1 D-3-phosphoglycerate dehydrogenase [Micromonospora sediminimaris]SFB99908.1 D-3-phosphoglycerate dehydrogenase [Micromonospora sediminimaris]